MGILDEVDEAHDAHQTFSHVQSAIIGDLPRMGTMLKIGAVFGVIGVLGLMAGAPELLMPAACWTYARLQHPNIWAEHFWGPFLTWGVIYPIPWVIFMMLPDFLMSSTGGKGLPWGGWIGYGVSAVMFAAFSLIYWDLRNGRKVLMEAGGYAQSRVEEK
ncbi:hypothetical protein GL267_007230 [Acidithiobacillus ferrianus]|uniref:Uncharacterized protein n=2 Tax=Acidithiobacillus ferrianus TaxID=2678518 RepID=A0A845U9E6_9PROT|nr:hypothetical protein [Acidithiobacillus ferrianus]NDU42065.1 hypothetical protein [Acidithiobacillus ferrianus]